MTYGSCNYSSDTPLYTLNLELAWFISSTVLVVHKRNLLLNRQQTHSWEKGKKVSVFIKARTWFDSYVNLWRTHIWQLTLFVSTKYPAYSQITLWFNRRPVGVADWFPTGPFHCVLIPKTDPHAYRAALEQHGDVGCRNDGMTTGNKKPDIRHKAVFLFHMHS